MESTNPFQSTTESTEPRKLRHPDKCRVCGIDIPARTFAILERSTKTVRCVACPTTTLAPHELVLEPPTAPTRAPAALISRAGASARREYERRRANDQERLRTRFGRLGSLAVALASDRQSTDAWRKGAIGEERLGSKLDSLAPQGISVLHDRGIPKSRANIDHLVVTSTGIWVVDAKRYQGRPELTPKRTPDGPRLALTIGKRDCTKLVDGVLWQRDHVQAAIPDVPVTAALCFIDADWPMFGAFFSIDDVHVVSPRQLSKLLRSRRHGDHNVAAIRQLLAAHFKPA